MRDTDTYVGLRAVTLVQQDQVWEGRDGPVRVDDMDVRRRRALLAWLRRHAEGIHHARLTELLLALGYDVDREREYQRLLALGSASWLEETPLVRKLARSVPRVSWPGRGLLRGRRRWWR